MKSYMIPEALFLDLVKYHLLDLQEPDRVERIRVGLTAKMEADARRRDYAASVANRSPFTFTEEWATMYDQWQKKEISSETFMKKMRLKPAVFLNMVTEYRKNKK